MRACFAGRTFKGENGEASGGGVWCNDAVVVVGGGMMDGCDDQIAGLGDVLNGEKD